VSAGKCLEGSVRPGPAQHDRNRSPAKAGAAPGGDSLNED